MLLYRLKSLSSPLRKSLKRIYRMWSQIPDRRGFCFFVFLGFFLPFPVCATERNQLHKESRKQNPDRRTFLFIPRGRQHNGSLGSETTDCISLCSVPRVASRRRGGGGGEKSASGSRGGGDGKDVCCDRQSGANE